MPRLTIVIPALGHVDSFETTILSVLENRPAHCEILVPQCGDYPDPYNLSDEVHFIEQPAAASGSELIDVALQAAQGDVVHLLGAGATVTPGWTDTPLERFSDRLLGSVCPLLLSVDETRIAALGVGYSAGGHRSLVAHGKKFLEKRIPKAKPIGPSLLAGFYCRQAIEEVGSWQSPVGDDLADIDLALSLSALGWTTAVDTQSRIHFDTSTLQQERSFRQAWNAERLFWRHAATVGWAKSLLCHPMTVAWESIGSLPQATALTQPLARMLAAVELPRHLRFHKELHNAAFEPTASVSHELPAEAVVSLERGDRPEQSQQSLRKAS